MFLRTIFLACFVIAAVSNVFPQAQTVVVRPVESDELLVNPGMGITTFQRFNGQEINAGLTWSEEGPTTGLPEVTHKPDFPNTSIAYCRWFWSAIEPEQERVRWEIIDAALQQARDHNQTLAIRLMPYDQKHPLPEWYRSSGARRANKDADKDGSVWQPDFADPLYLKFWGRLIMAAGARYDGKVDYIAMGALGA